MIGECPEINEQIDDLEKKIAQEKKMRGIMYSGCSYHAERISSLEKRIDSLNRATFLLGISVIILSASLIINLLR